MTINIKQHLHFALICLHFSHFLINFSTPFLFTWNYWVDYLILFLDYLNNLAVVLGTFLRNFSHIRLWVLTSLMWLSEWFIKALSLDKCCWEDSHGCIPRIMGFTIRRRFPGNLKLLWLQVPITTIRFLMIRMLRIYLWMRSHGIAWRLDKILWISVSFIPFFAETLLGGAAKIGHISYLLFLYVEVLDYVHVSILYLCIFLRVVRNLCVSAVLNTNVERRSEEVFGLLNTTGSLQTRRMFIRIHV